MSVVRGRRWFIRLTKTNNVHKVDKNGNYIKDENGQDVFEPYEYDFEKLFKDVCIRYERVLYIVHDKDINNIHAHFCIQDNQQIRFDTLKKMMPYGQIVKQRGSNKEVIDYFLHQDENSKNEGKDIYDENQIITNIHDLDAFKKIVERQRSDMNEFVNEVMNGTSRKDLINMFPSHMARYKSFYEELVSLRDDAEIEEQVNSKKFRDMYVIYAYGKSGTGKSYALYDMYQYKDVYKVNLKNPFDNYRGQDVLFIDDYKGQYDFTDLLNYLDIYPLNLPARYCDRVAKYTKVYITSNLSLEQLYPNINQEQFNALYRRINEIRHYTSFGNYSIEKLTKDNRTFKLDTLNDELPF